MYEISILITAYNSEKYIVDSINSIIAQSYRSWTIIAVDDGSTDNTYKILNNFKIKLKNQLLIIKNNKNLGINISLNKALKEVKTSFFARQDADDISLPNRLEILIDSLKKNYKYHFVSSRMESIYNSSIIYPVKLIDTPKKNDFISSLPFCNAPTLFRSEILDNIKFNTSLMYRKRFEDYEFFFQCYLRNYVGYNLNDITYLVRQDYNYHTKITIKQRFVEVYLKFQIYKEFSNNLNEIIHIFIPIFKIFTPNFLIKFSKKYKIK